MILRQRLAASGDMPAAPGNTTAFDSYVDAAIKRYKLPDDTNDDSIQQAFKGNEAIADMALENFVEMRDSVDDEAFLLRKAPTSSYVLRT